MARKRPITAFGWEIKRRLAELQLDQREFCRINNIPENRLGDIMTGARKAIKQRQQIQHLLGIDNFPQEKAE